MSTREKVNDILDKMTEKQLLAILAMFEECFFQTGNGGTDDVEEDIKQKRQAAEIIEKLRKPYVGEDDKAELAKARDERFGL